MRMGGWRARSRLVSLWFDIGALVALGCSMLATALLSLLLYNTIMRKTIKQQVLVPVVCFSKFKLLQLFMILNSEFSSVYIREYTLLQVLATHIYFISHCRCLA